MDTYKVTNLIVRPILITPDLFYYVKMKQGKQNKICFPSNTIHLRVQNTLNN